MARKVDSPHVAARAAAREALGLRLRVLRVGLKLSNKAVAELMDVRPATLSSWEQGTSELTALDALRLADLYQVEIAVLFGRAPMPLIVDPTVR